MAQAPDPTDVGADWQRRVVGRSLKTARQRSIDRGSSLIKAAAALLERSNGAGFTVQDVADEAGQSLRTLYQYFESKDDLLLAVFEEAMGVYARLIADAIVDLEDPVDRLAGALLTAARLPELASPGVNTGLARLRLRLTEAEPELVGRSQAPVTTLFGELLDAAADHADLTVDRDAATFVLLALNTATVTSDTLGNDVGVRRPDVEGLVRFCLRGLGADVELRRLRRINGRLRLPKRPMRLGTK
jgi:AcrR family transcriptional regulator